MQSKARVHAVELSRWLSEALTMRRRILLVAFALSLCGCGEQPDAPAREYRRWTDQWIVRLGLPFFGIEPCRGLSKHLPYEECLKISRPQQWHGVWVTGEGERFCPGATTQCPGARPSTELWFNERTFRSRPQISGKMNEKYAVEFVGRRTDYPVGSAWARHYEIIVDQMISMKDIGPDD